MECEYEVTNELDTLMPSKSNNAINWTKTAHSYWASRNDHMPDKILNIVNSKYLTEKNYEDYALYLT